MSSFLARRCSEVESGSCVNEDAGELVGVGGWAEEDGGGSMAGGVDTGVAPGDGARWIVADGVNALVHRVTWSERMRAES